jgi:hypothetical protein
MLRGEQILLTLSDSKRPEAAAVLASSRLHCDACTANFLGGDHGCLGWLGAPLSSDWVSWLLQRLQPLDTLGGSMFMAALKDGSLADDVCATWREQNALPALSTRVLKWGSLTRRVTSDQLLAGLLNTPLDPPHATAVLLWLGLLAIDGKRPDDIEAVAWLATLDTPERRANRTELSLGEAPEPLAALLTAIYVAWLNGVTLCLETV